MHTHFIASTQGRHQEKGPGIFPGYYGRDPWLLLLENRRKIEPKGP